MQSIYSIIWFAGSFFHNNNNKFLSKQQVIDLNRTLKLDLIGYKLIIAD